MAAPASPIRQRVNRPSNQQNVRLKAQHANHVHVAVRLCTSTLTFFSVDLVGFVLDTDFVEQRFGAFAVRAIALAENHDWVLLNAVESVKLCGLHCDVGLF